MEALNPVTSYEPEYVELTLADKTRLKVRKENRATFNNLEAQLLMDADFELYGDGYFDDAA